MNAVMVGDRRIGTVAKFIAHKPAERWVAWSIHRPQPDQERTEKFPTRRAAIAWLEKTDSEASS